MAGNEIYRDNKEAVVHVRTLRSLLIVSALALAGCSGGGGGGKEVDPTEDLGLEATETTGVIRGVVVDETIVPLPGVVITLLSNGQTAESNAFGAFGFEGLEPGSYFISASKPGFKPVQQSADVEAGVEDPRVVRVMMLADPTSQPTYEVFHFQGFLECSALTGPFFWPCENYATGEPVGVDQYYVEYPVSGNASFIHVSLVWDATQAFGRNLYFNLFDGYDEYQVAEYGGGPSPLFGDANATEIADTDINEQGYLAFEVASHGERVAVPDNPVTGPGSLGAGASVKQAFDAYIVVFYGFEPPEGYNFVDDGEPKVPQ